MVVGADGLNRKNSRCFLIFTKYFIADNQRKVVFFSDN
jgi:hypothetical protein